MLSFSCALAAPQATDAYYRGKAASWAADESVPAYLAKVRHLPFQLPLFLNIA